MRQVLSYLVRNHYVGDVMLEILLRVSYAWRRAVCAFRKHNGQETYEVARPRWPAWASVEVRCAKCDATIKVEERSGP